MLYVLKMMMCSSSQNVNLPEGHIPSLVRITTQPLGAALRSTLPSLSSSTSCTNSFRTNLTKKKHVERLGLKVAYHRNHGMYIYMCVCVCDYIYYIYMCNNMIFGWSETVAYHGIPRYPFNGNLNDP
jgi:hypothetical protein